MIKVCCNCKHFVRDREYSDWCGAPIGKLVKEYIYGNYRKQARLDTGSPNYPNRHGNCKYYARSWWKFWGINTILSIILEASGYKEEKPK